MTLLSFGPISHSSIPRTVLLSDTFTGTNGSGWNASNWLLGQNPLVGGGATIQSNMGQLQLGSQGDWDDDSVRRRANIGQVADFDMTFACRFPDLDLALAILYRADTTALHVQTCWQLLIAPNYNAVQLSRWNSWSETSLQNSTFTMATNTLYWVRLRAVGSQHQAKIWTDGSSEPPVWNLSGTDGSIPGAGYLGIVLNATPVSQIALIDTVTITTP